MLGHLDTGLSDQDPRLSGKVARFAVACPSGLSLTLTAARDASGHGTRIASAMVGSNGDGFAGGVAPGARLCSAAVIEAGNVLARIVLALDWLAGLDVPVVVLPLGLPIEMPVVRSLIWALSERGKLVIGSIGNGGAGRGLYPGAYPDVLSVGSCDAAGRPSRFSSSRSTSPRSGKALAPLVLAPGEEVATIDHHGRVVPFTGTSIAAARVAALAALLHGAFPAATANDIAAAMVRTAAHLPDGCAHRAVRGAVQPHSAFEWLAAGNTGPGAPRQTARLRYVDPRLDRLLDIAGAETSMDAIVEFACGDERAEFLRDLVAGPHGPDACVLLRAVPACTVRLPAQAMRRLLADPRVLTVQSGEIDRAALI